MRPRLLDLFCGGGGAAVGYHRAGFEVVGVDIDPHPRYPFRFWHADALEIASETWVLDAFDAIHASPPCQAYSMGTAQQRAGGIEYPDLLGPTRELLERSRAPWIIENVPGAPMRPDLKLCGCMFGLPLLRRERWFETSWRAFALRPPCSHVGPALSVTGHGAHAGSGQRDRVAATLGRRPDITDARRAMGIAWMNRDELSEAIPPDYTENVGELALEELGR